MGTRDDIFKKLSAKRQRTEYELLKKFKKVLDNGARKCYHLNVPRKNGPEP